MGRTGATDQPRRARSRPIVRSPMRPLSPQVMHKLVFTILVHGLPDAQTGTALDVLTDALSNPNGQVRELAVVALAELPVSPARRVAVLAKGMKDANARVRRRSDRALGAADGAAPPAAVWAKPGAWEPHRGCTAPVRLSSSPASSGRPR